MTARRVKLSEVPDVPSPAAPPSDVFRTFKTVCELPDPPGEQQLLGHLVVKGNRTLVLADSGHGKTTICLQMLRAIVCAEPFLNRQGKGDCAALVIDCEQGLRSVKRGLREAGLDLREDCHHWHQPDGLALDHDFDQVATLDNFLTYTRPDLVLLDPFYKAHQADDPNSERAVVDLMRTLDALRTNHHFALLMPVHPRKSDGRSNGVRKLALEDVAGSGAIYRGAEVVIAIERLHHGHARLRYLKDRDGDMPIGETVPLTFTRGIGFEEDEAPQQREHARTSLEEELLELAAQGFNGTSNEWRDRTGKNKNQIHTTLKRLYDQGRLGRHTNVPGRQHNAVVWGSTDPQPRLADWSTVEAVTQQLQAHTGGTVALADVIQEMERQGYNTSMVDTDKDIPF